LVGNRARRIKKEKKKFKQAAIFALDALLFQTLSLILSNKWINKRPSRNKVSNVSTPSLHGGIASFQMLRILLKKIHDSEGAKVILAHFTLDMTRHKSHTHKKN
jgi:hypothetical protein